MPTPLIRATSLTVGYAQRPVVRDLSLTIGPGEFWCCLGRNGAGKTTLLHTLLGTLAPQQGQLWRHPSLETRQGLGFVPQRCAINPTLPTTVREFVLLGTVGTTQDRRARQAHLHWALARVGLDGMARCDYWSLSGGQQQRALVARALIRRPQLLLLDEPTSGFDPPTIEALLDCLAALQHDEGVAIFCVTHDLPLLGRYATHFLLLADGQGQAGPAATVLTPQALARVYGTALAVQQDPSGTATVRITRAGAGP